jgi:ribosomal RNA-processing protein 8
MSLVDKMRAKLSGGRFRMLNEALYTTTGDEALRMVENQPGLFSAYHAGFREQTKEWPTRPLDVCLKWLATQPKTLKIADFGCGDAELARRAPQKIVHSFDLESEAPGVVACNMAHVPLEDSSVEVAVFSLSLMGTDYGSFMEEAHRVRHTTRRGESFVSSRTRFWSLRFFRRGLFASFFRFFVCGTPDVFFGLSKRNGARFSLRALVRR